MALNPIQVNGTYFDHSSTRIILPFGNNDLTTIHIKSISYQQSLEPGIIEGVHAVDNGTGVGKYKANSNSFTIAKEAWDLLLSALPSGYGTITFDFEIFYVSRSTFQDSKVKFVGARITSVGGGTSSGSAGLEVTVNFYCKQIFEGLEEKSLAPKDLDSVPVLLA